MTTHPTPQRLAIVLAIASAIALPALLTAAAPAAAQGRTESTRPLGLAGAFTANASGNGAIYHNPAGVATALMYAFEGQYLYAPGMNTFNASIVDSRINPHFALGAAYSFEDSTDDGSDLQGHDARLALASQLVPQRLVVGLGGRYLYFTEGDTHPLDAFTLDVGLVLRLADGFFLGVSGNNLIDPCDGKEVCIDDAATRTVDAGLAFGSSFGLQLTGDVRTHLAHTDDVTLEYAAGLEYLAAQLVALRLGYRFLDDTNAHVIAAGLGVRANTAGIDLGYTQDLESNEYRLSVALQLYLMP